MNRSSVCILWFLTSDLLSTKRNKQKEIEALHEAKRRFYNVSQHKTASCQAYLETFKNLIEAVQYSGGEIGIDPGILQRAMPAGASIEMATDKQMNVAKDIAQQEYIACGFMLGADRNRYGNMIEDL